jgi:signal peptidase I
MKTWFKKFFKSLFNVKEWVNAIFFALIFAGIFRTFFFEPYRIPTGSMIPNLLIGDYLFISKYAYGYSKHSFPITLPIFDGRINFKSPKRGDIIVFRGPKDDGMIYVKRLIGLPGDKIQMIRGVLYINSTPVKHEPITIHANARINFKSMQVSEIKETLPNGVNYSIYDENLHFHLDFPDQTDIYEVPAEHYFMMGDNRNNSVDSRYQKDMGYIHEELLLGKVVYRFWSKDFSLMEFIKSRNTGRAFEIVP